MYKVFNDPKPFFRDPFNLIDLGVVLVSSFLLTVNVCGVSSIHASAITASSNTRFEGTVFGRPIEVRDLIMYYASVTVLPNSGSPAKYSSLSSSVEEPSESEYWSMAATPYNFSSSSWKL